MFALVDPAAYSYPEHLRHSLESLPNAPGVYTFHGDSEAMPLYVGKSVNIRTRVMSHFRSPAEARMLRRARHVSYVRTAGDLGAQLLEAMTIKAQQPLHNKKLRRTRRLCSLSITGDTPNIVRSQDVDFSTSGNLYGLFSSRTAALAALRSLADAHGLCYGVLGIETLPSGKRCFRSALGRCLGACHGLESRAEHANRLMVALADMRVICWPYRTGVGVVEKGPDMTQIHVVRNWHYLGTAPTVAQARKLVRPTTDFDADAYRILVKAMLSNTLELKSL